MALTIEKVHARCVEVGNCWIWQQGKNSDGQPSARDGADGSVSVRRRIWELHRGKLAKRGYFVVAQCGHKQCVSPSCARHLNGKEYMAWLNRTGAINNAAHVAKIVAAVRRRSKLSPEKAADIVQRISDGEDSGKVASDHGIARGHANRVARGDQWQTQLMPNASVFSMRP